MNWDKEYIELPHSYVLEVADEKFFERVKQELPSILQFLQSEGEIKGYSLDNAAMLGNKEGFILGRLAYKTDVYVPVDGLLDDYIDWLEEGENKNDSRK
jgi:hypothetical protein